MNNRRMKMRRCMMALALLRWFTVPVSAAPFTLAEVVESLSVRYDRVDTYNADADVYQYST